MVVFFLGGGLGYSMLHSIEQFLRNPYDSLIVFRVHLKRPHGGKEKRKATRATFGVKKEIIA